MTFVSAATQTTFDVNAYQGQEGALYDFATACDGLEDSKAAGVAIPFGRAVCTAAATPNVCALPTDAGTAARVIGVSVVDNQHATYTGGYPVDSQVRILRFGRIWVKAEGAVADLAPAYVRFTESTTGAADLGRFRGDTDTGKALQYAGARFRSMNGVVSGAGPVVLELTQSVTGATGATGPTGPTGATGGT
jgi:hypothetical protein